MQLTAFLGHTGFPRRCHMSAMDGSRTTRDGYIFQWETDGVLTNGKAAGPQAIFIKLEVSVQKNGEYILCKDYEILKSEVSSNPVDPGADLDWDKVDKRVFGDLATAISNLSSEQRQADLAQAFEEIAIPKDANP